jgi:molybdopterin-guanine dinucleotide biosynthesis protein A
VPANLQNFSGTLGVILAGGKSSRMGRDKARLIIGENHNAPTLLDFMYRKLETTNLFDEIVISRNEKTDGDDNKILPDVYPDLGPVGALHALSVHYPNRNALIVPVDMPLLETEVIARLCSSNSDSHNAIYYEGYYFPLLIQFNETVTANLTERVKNKTADLSIAGLLRDIKAAVGVAPNDLVQFTNANTEEEWLLLKRSIGCAQNVS